jgi:hypothetical protein
MISRTNRRDKQDGRPIYIEQLGKLDLTKLYTMTTPERQLQSLVVEYERFVRDRLPICSKLAGHLIETSCTIMDLKDVGVSQFWKVKSYVQEASGSAFLSFLVVVTPSSSADVVLIHLQYLKTIILRVYVVLRN